MTLEYSEHALDRMKERRVARREVELCIEGSSKRKIEQGRTVPEGVPESKEVSGS